MSISFISSYQNDDITTHSYTAVIFFVTIMFPDFEVSRAIGLVNSSSNVVNTLTEVISK